MSTAFQAISVVGGVVPPSLLGRIQSGEVNDPKSLDPASYHLMGTETVRDASSRSWGYLRTAWQSWRELDAKKRPDGQGAGTGDARQKWLLILLREFGYGQVPATGGGLQAADVTYPISHRWESVPIHLLGPGVELDKRSPGVEGAAKRAPQAMVQEFLNRESDYLWAVLSNGLKLRLLRDSTALAGSAYIEFDLETIFDSDLYPEFQILWQLCHQSRLDKRGGAEGSPADCWLESWRAESVDAGARALDKLGVGVEEALDYLGTGFLRHPENGWLVDALHAGELSPRDFHKALLRTAYRLLFCFVVEDRNALLAPDAPAASRERYAKYFSTQRLRKLSRSRDGGPHPDLWRTQKLVLSALGGNGLEAVGLPALGGLFDPDSRAKKLEHQPHEDLFLGAELANQDFLKAIRRLSWVLGKGDRLQPVDYRHLGAEELGSVYESLLELIPRIDTETRSFELVRLAGNERKVTGSYYTPPNLVTALLDTALDRLLDDAVNGGKDAADRESRLLALTVCDPASGSGGFLVAAARRIARRLAEVRAGENEPTPAEIQHSLHDVVERCIYGVDMNDLAAELAKVSLWLEAMEPGKPLGFLDARIKIGNSLLGTTPALLAGGVPDEAFGVLEGDDKKYAAEVKKRNKAENVRSKSGGRFVHGGQEALSFGQTTTGVAELIGRRQELVQPVSTAAEARSRAKAYAEFDHSADMEQKRLHADAWCAAFVWPLNAGEAEPPTSSVVRQLGEAGEVAGHPDTVATVRQLAEEYRFFHWHLEFPEIFGDPASRDIGAEGWPGGFSCMLGNPPWERVKIQEQEFFAARDETIAKAPSAAARTRLIKELVNGDPILHKEFSKAKRNAEGQSLSVRKSRRYPLCGHGDINTYAVFAELFGSLVSPMGQSGFIVKSGLVSDDTYKRFPGMLAKTGRLQSFYDFENRGNGKNPNGKPKLYFEDVDSREKFCLITIGGSKRSFHHSVLAFFVKNLTDRDLESFSLTPDEIKLINPNTGTLPIFRTRRDAQITLGIYRRVPVLVNEADSLHGNPWGVFYLRLVHAGDHAEELFMTRDNLMDPLPVREGKTIHHFDHRYATYSDGVPVDVSSNAKIHGTEYSPRYWVEKSFFESLMEKYADQDWFLAYRDIARTTDARTVIAAAIPRAPATVDLPILGSTHSERLLLLGNFNSFVFDYVTRQKSAGTHMSFFLLKQLPVLAEGAYLDFQRKIGVSSSWVTERLTRLSVTDSDMLALGHHYGMSQPCAWDEDRRNIMKAELDAAYFHMYGISREDAGYILDTFPIIARKDNVQFGEYRTRRLILEIFEEMQNSIDSGVSYQSKLTPPFGHDSLQGVEEVSA
jgi:hypothetical protein